MLRSVRQSERFAVISDFHLGRAGAELACAVATDDIVRAMGALRGAHDLVVVNGDIFDLERGVVPFAFSHELRLLSYLHERSLDALSGEAVVWTVGNHDRLLLSLGRAVEAVDVETPLGVVRVEHGDRFNAPIKQFRPFTSLVTWASGRAVSARALWPMYRVMHDLDLVLTGSTVSQDEPIAMAAVRWLEASPAYAAMVIGHTHTPLLRHVRGGGLVMNPGGCTDTLSALSVDATSGLATLLRWDGDQWERWHAQRFGAAARDLGYAPLAR